MYYCVSADAYTRYRRVTPPRSACGSMVLPINVADCGCAAATGSINRYVRPTGHAVVLGGSMAGLLTARVLSIHFGQVTLIERDPVHRQPEVRKGQPQTRHLHGLLVNGLDLTTRYFPDLPDALEDHGALVADMAESMHWYAYGGYRRTFTLGRQAAVMSRPLLEHLIRERTLARGNVTVLDRCVVRGLAASSDRRRITGVRLEHQRDRMPGDTLEADLIVDCTGRGSRTPQWLVELGYRAPARSEVVEPAPPL